jgi:hypothetical protein
MFHFQNDLLPLSLSEAERPEDGFSEKTVGLYNGDFRVFSLSLSLLWSKFGQVSRWLLAFK